ncbi:tripartite tricarboxylate transporter TctB family protein [Evansella sp. AB-P1]|uniref:tripartite tricarboxylate transporter TctB family protein n=1 Tax=Evansella sp. AB-P1 TaxID=3037653 RepID=UPI00241EF2B5|nr:tripartite tricarboxylate transporter TctB family protein [Evansella sp. AB-P1]MDG5788056.1 tripartite tricarboxylate transporter TctB family protein [Evansella sp. AB-P1]
MTKADRNIGIVLIMIAVIMLYQALTLEHPHFNRDPGPVLMPVIYSISLIICSLGLLFWPRIAENKKESKTQQSKEQYRKNTTKMVGLFLFLVFYVWSFKTLGFILSTIIFLGGSILFLAKKRERKFIIISILTSILCTGFIYYIFKIQLKIQLPVGVFF